MPETTTRTRTSLVPESLGPSEEQRIVLGHVEPATRPTESDDPVRGARKRLGELGLAIEREAISETPEQGQEVETRLAAAKLALGRVRHWLAHKLRLDEAIFEVQTGLGTGILGLWEIGVSRVLVCSGSKTGNRPVMSMTAPSTSLQAGLFTANYSYVPGTDRPNAYGFGLGPFKYKIYDPVHRSPLIGLSIPLVGSVALGPKMFGMSAQFPIPWAPIVRWGGGLYVSHPWLEPICGSLWNAGGWVVAHAKSLTKPIRDCLGPPLNEASAPLRRWWNVMKADVARVFDGTMVHRPEFSS